MENNLENLTIGVFAKAAGVNVETIRFYQRKGLLLEPDKPYGSIRRYGEADVTRVRFVKSAQRLGFSLDEIAELLRLEDGTHCEEASSLAEHKLQDVREKMADALTPGFQVEFDPDEAERVGAFVEDALSEQDAAASGDDLVEVDGALEPAFLDDEGPSADIPPFITTTNARELYDLRPGETVAQAAARKASEG